MLIPAFYPGENASREVSLHAQHGPLVAVYGVPGEPRQRLDAVGVVLAVGLPVAHVPVLAVGIAADHEEGVRVHVLEETVGDARGHDNDVAPFDDGLDAAGVELAAKTELCAAGGDAEDLVGGAVEVGGVVHCVAPLGGDDADAEEVGFDGVGGGVGVLLMLLLGGGEGGVVDEEGLGGEGGVGEEVVGWDEVFGDAELGEGG